jgi:hypothetical protein
MLILRDAQKEILARRSFEVWLMDHVQRFFAEECREMGRAGSLAFMREMVGRARARGLRRGPELCSYVDLAFAFGRDFESEPWASRLVAEAGERWSEFTLDALFEAAMKVLDPSVGLGVEDEDDFQVVEDEDEDDFQVVEDDEDELVEPGEEEDHDDEDEDEDEDDLTESADGGPIR